MQKKKGKSCHTPNNKTQGEKSAKLKKNYKKSSGELFQKILNVDYEENVAIIECKFPEERNDADSDGGCWI